MIITIGRDHHASGLCLTWNFSNEHEVCSLEHYRNMEWLYVGTGYIDFSLKGKKTTRYIQGHTYSVEQYSSQIVECSYPHDGCSTFWINSLDGKKSEFEVFESQKNGNELTLCPVEYDRWLVVISGHINCNNNHLPTRTIIKIKANQEIKIIGTTPQSLLHNREEIENKNFIVGIIKK